MKIDKSRAYGRAAAGVLLSGLLLGGLTGQGFAMRRQHFAEGGQQGRKRTGGEGRDDRPPCG